MVKTPRLEQPSQGLDQHVATRLRTLRERAGLSVGDVANQTGIPAQTIEDYELGVLRCPVRDLYSIAQSIGVMVAELFEGYQGN